MKINYIKGEELKQLVLRAQSGDANALNLVFDNTCNFVRTIAFKYSHINNYIFDDIYQEGLLGLLEAIHKYVYNDKFEFLTFAYYYIIKYIYEYIYKEFGGSIRYPKYIAVEIFKIKKYTNIDINDIDIINELMNFLKCDIIHANEIHRILLNEKILSSDMQIKNSDNDSVYMIDFFTSDDDTELSIIRQNIVNSLYEKIEELPEKSRTRLILKYGLYNEKEHTLTELAKIENITKQAVEQQMKNTLKILRCKLPFDKTVLELF